MPMKPSVKTRPGPADAVAAGVILLLAALLALSLWVFTQEGGDGALTAVVSVGGEEVDRVPLGPDAQERTYTHNGYTLHVDFSASSVQVSEADCPTQDCVHTGAIRRPGQSIICLPARVVIQLVGRSADGGVDAVIG